MTERGLVGLEEETTFDGMKLMVEERDVGFKLVVGVRLDLNWFFLSLNLNSIRISLK